MFQVVIETANREVRKVRCLGANCGVGKNENNLVVLQGWDIADDHAAFRVRSDGVFMEVLGGRAPVTVNGQLVAHRDAHGPLRKEDIVSIGAYRLRVLAETPAIDEQAAARRDLLVRLSTAATNNAQLEREAVNSDYRESHEPKVTASNPDAVAKPVAPDAAMLNWRLKVHGSLVRQMDLRRVDVRGMKDDELRVKTSELIEDIIAREWSWPAGGPAC
jgi:pilus assembly protein CpaF